MALNHTAKLVLDEIWKDGPMSVDQLLLGLSKYAPHDVIVATVVDLRALRYLVLASNDLHITDRAIGALYS